MNNPFKKKNPVRKVPINFEERPEQEIKINIKPLVKIDFHESRVNGKPNKPEYVISIAERDNIILSEREYNELFSEMLADMDDTKLIHLISEAHMLKHAEGSISENIGRMLHKVVEGGLLEQMIKQADKNS